MPSIPYMDFMNTSTTGGTISTRLPEGNRISVGSCTRPQKPNGLEYRTPFLLVTSLYLHLF
jgi:hypothetical protein